MFSWASSKFNEQLSQIADTLAPPPDTPEHKFLTALKRNDVGAMGHVIQSLAHCINDVLNVASNLNDGAWNGCWCEI